MDTKRICPSCQKPLAPDAPMGLCPECLVKAGFPTGAESDSGSGAPRGFVPPTVEEIARLFPQLEILEFIGKGGMGAIYKARQKQLNRVVALKILPPGIGSEPAFAERFTREAQALAQLNHPNIVTLYEFGQTSGQFYFLMEFVDGMNLRQLLQSGRISPREALAIVPQICDALQFAHDQGIVHRDIKPENILLDRRGRVKVADFGLAKLVGGSEPVAEGAATGSPALTESGKIMGTPNYMAPEQKENPADVDHRADIYALGVVFYQMLTGELPGKRIEPPSKKVHIDVRLDEVVLRALEKKPELRYQQASEVKTSVETIVGSAAAGARAFPEPRFSKAKIAIAIGVAAVLAAIVLKAVFFPAPPDSYFLPDYTHFQRLPSGLFILRPTHFSTPIDGLDYSCETDSPSGDHVTWNMGRNRSFAQLLCRIYNCDTNQIVLPPGAPSERFDYLYTLRDPDGLKHFEAAIEKLGYTAHWEDQPVRMLVVEKVTASTPSAIPNPIDSDDAAVSAAQSWLSLIDNGNYQESWNDAAPFFQNAVAEPDWEKSMTGFRKPLGDLLTRKLKSLNRQTQMPGAPDGEYVVMQFDTSFADKKSAVETVTVGPKQGDQWKVSGYYIK